jgi:acyl transferase domain-containing protein
MPASQRIAIVGMGGIFPSPGAARTTPARLWELVLGAVDASRDVPEGRWALSPDECFAPEVGAVDKVYSRRGYFIDSCRCDPAGLDISADVLARLDPLFHLTLAAGVEAFAPAATGRRQHRAAHGEGLGTGARLPGPHLRGEGVGPGG